MVSIIFISLLGFISLGLFVYFVIIFNGLKGLIINIDRAKSNIDVLLKQRFDEIPQLVRVCKGYIGYESSILKEITELRSKFETTKETIYKNKLNQFLTEKIHSLYENYPNLKASEQFLNLQKRISDLEMEIADRREFYNDSVAAFNIRLESLPDIVVAKILGYKKERMFRTQ